MEKNVSSYLESHLKHLRIQDPFRAESLGAVVQFLRESITGSCLVFNISVEDMFFSILNDGLLTCFQECITRNNDALLFRSPSGNSVESFME